MQASRAPDARLRARPWLVAAAVFVVGTLIGIASELAGELPSPWFYTAGLGAPWLIASFFTARLCRTNWTSALAGIGVLLSGLIVVAVGRGSAYIEADPLLAFWGLLVVVAGETIGLAAWASRDDRSSVRAVAWALP